MRVTIPRLFKTALAIVVIAVVPFIATYGYFAFGIFVFRDFGGEGLGTLEWVFVLSAFALCLLGAVVVLVAYNQIVKGETFGSGFAPRFLWIVSGTSALVAIADRASGIQEDTSIEIGLQITILIAVSSAMAALTARRD